MSTKTVTKQTPLRCLDCEHEFDRWAMHKEHYVESGTVLATTVFDRALVNCEEFSLPSALPVPMLTLTTVK
jgi:hypothetical protein